MKFQSSQNRTLSRPWAPRPVSQPDLLQSQIPHMQTMAPFIYTFLFVAQALLLPGIDDKEIARKSHFILLWRV
jgi:hypothetical protein